MGLRLTWSSILVAAVSKIQGQHNFNLDFQLASPPLSPTFSQSQCLLICVEPG